MAYWWVNHKQTHRAELNGGYVWSPKTRTDGGYNQTYENLRLTRPGDVVFSYADGQIKAVGSVVGDCREAPKPTEFGAAGDAWSALGWLVPISWESLSRPVRPKDHIEVIAPLLPGRYSPIRGNGDGNQGCYLAAITDELGLVLLDLTGCSEFENDSAEAAVRASDLPATQKEQIVLARRGQGLFRTNVMRINPSCRVTHIAVPGLLVASHIKPWSVSDNRERLDGYNGLMLAPHVDRLFDSGWISFEDDGAMIAPTAIAQAAIAAWGIAPDCSIGALPPAQSVYMAYHRQYRLKRH